MSSNNDSDSNVKDISKRRFLRSGTAAASAPISRITHEPEPQGKKVLGVKKFSGMSRRSFVKVAAGAAAVVGLALTVPLPQMKSGSNSASVLNYKGKITPQDRRVAAIRANALRTAALSSGVAHAALVPVPGGVPDYFGGYYPNYANSPLPTPTVTIPTAGTVTGVTVSNGGSGYSTPHVTISGGGGTGATATARVSNGVITGVIITSPGANYTAPPTVTFSDPHPRAAGAAAIASVTPNSPTVTFTGGLQKFVDSLPGLGSGAANNLGQYIPIATPGTLAGHPNDDYYEIELVEYTEQMHSNLPVGSTKLRGYHQVGSVDPPHYLGPIIIAQRNRPVRIKFTNNLPVGTAGNLFIPVDTSYMGAGKGPDGVNPYTENRATIHLHGGTTPWISDGTPHTWIVPAAENTTIYKQGASVYNVPDMPAPGGGSTTLFWSNQQSARLMFYHDHALGITRLNVYCGEAAAYLLQDPTETALVSGGTITPLAPSPLAPVTIPAGGIVPSAQIPLVIQDKTFLDPTTINAQDPTWNGPLTLGTLWWPHVYMTNQNPWDVTGANPMGRWDYGPWFWPPFTGLQHGAINNPYFGAAGEPPMIPGVPSISGTPESFMDTPLVNGTAYPYVVLNPQAYRFRILNACNDRMLNLQFYQTSTIVGRIILTSAGSGYTSDPIVTLSGGGGTGASARATIDALGHVNSLTLVAVGTGYTSSPSVSISAPTGASPANATAVAQVYTGATEVGMVPAVPEIWPAGWGTPDSRDGGWPDPNLRGPAMIQIGTEGGVLPAPALINNVPVGYDYNRRSITVLNVLEHSLLIGPAERADIIVDFTPFAGKTLILYNDCPAPIPGIDPRLDYYTANPDYTLTGGTPSTLPGFGPNMRTIMQIRVAGAGGTAPPDYYNPATLTALQTALPAAFAASQETIIVPQTSYNAVYGTAIPATDLSQFARIQDTTHAFNPIGAAGSSVTAITVLNGGLGYTTAPAVTIAPPTTAGGVRATATATVSGGGVALINLTNPGTGYTTPPTVVFTGGLGAGGTAATATATVGSSALSAVTVANHGTGYSSPPTVGFTGGGGSGAAATATIGSGPLTGVTISNAGTGYTSAPAVAFSGGGGTGAIAVATIGSGPVTAITVTAGGTRYATAPTVTLSGGGGTGATATATITTGTVNSITVTNGGSGYTSLPTVTISGGGGTGATATAVVPGATGTVTGITLTNPGINFTSAPTVALTGGGGSGAAATAGVPANAGWVTGITLTNPGTGYTSAPTVTLTGGGGSGATATATALTGGIASIIITNPGSGYTSAPAISFTGGGGSGATATAAIGGTVSGITIVNAGSGYTTAPAVTIAPPPSGGVGAAALASVNLLVMPMQPKAIQELFTTDYGRMNALLGNEVPNTTGLNQTTIIQAYVDPPAELVQMSTAATPIGSLADGTQLWKITHNGVDTHVIHFHLFTVQLVNRVGWDGAIKPPDENEVGWKDTVRMNPLEDAIVALKPITINTPFAVPDSIRLLDPTAPLGATGPLMGFTNVDPLGNPVTVTNQLVNYGWEYVYHCHILGHEENDMMRPVCATTGVPPTGNPQSLTGTRSGTTVTLNWSNATVGARATNITVDRATNSAFTTGLVSTIIPHVLNTPLQTTYADTTAPATGTLYYRVKASNVIGIVGLGAYPTISSDSTPSNTLTV